MGMDIENRSQYAIHFQIGQSFWKKRPFIF
jgi:hypothetical protein